MKSMKLYDEMERIHNELRALGIAADSNDRSKVIAAAGASNS